MVWDVPAVPMLLSERQVSLDADIRLQLTARGQSATLLLTFSGKVKQKPARGSVTIARVVTVEG